MGWTAKDLANKGFAQVNGGDYQNITKKVGGRKTAKVKTLPVLMPKGTPNKKVMNATKVVAYGLTFDSKLEYHMYESLVAAKIEFDYHKVYELQPLFEYRGLTIRPIRIEVDFKLKNRNTIIDTKGHSIAMSKLKYKLLKYLFFKHNDEPEIFMPSCKEEVNFLISRLKYVKE